MLPQSFLIAITDCGDSGVLAAMVAVSSFYLWANHCRRGAAALLFSFAGASIEIGLLKLWFLGCMSNPFSESIHSPSGHCALSAAVMGTCVLLCRGNMQKTAYFLLAFVVFILAAIIAYSRVALHFHTINEVIIGFLVGIQVVFMTYLLLFRNKTMPYFNLRAWAGLLLATGFVFHGLRLPAESLLHEWVVKMNMPAWVCMDK